MSQLLELGGSVPDSHAPVDDGGGQFRRMLVPIDSSGPKNNGFALAVRMGRTACARLRLIHVQIWDPPVPKGGGRFYPETSEEATAVLDDGLSYAWACEVEASGVVVDAERSLIAPAILTEACSWGADVIVLTQAPRRRLNLGFGNRVSRQVMRRASCPVLVLFQGQA
jgi:nucleotide-binding universal stress UspA family protein